MSAMKAILDDTDACHDNEYSVHFGSSGPLLVVEFGDIERVIDMVENPDKTFTSSRRTNPGSFPLTVFVGSAAYDYMESWQLITLNGGDSAKRLGVVLYPKGSPQSTNNVTIPLSGCQVGSASISGASMGADGKKLTAVYTVSYDDVPFL